MVAGAICPWCPLGFGRYFFRETGKPKGSQQLTASYFENMVLTTILRTFSCESWSWLPPYIDGFLFRLTSSRPRASLARNSRTEDRSTARPSPPRQKGVRPAIRKATDKCLYNIYFGSSGCQKPPQRARQSQWEPSDCLYCAVPSLGRPWLNRCCNICLRLLD